MARSPPRKVLLLELETHGLIHDPGGMVISHIYEWRNTFLMLKLSLPPRDEVMNSSGIWKNYPNKTGFSGLNRGEDWSFYVFWKMRKKFGVAFTFDMGVNIFKLLCFKKSPTKESNTTRQGKVKHDSSRIEHSRSSSRTTSSSTNNTSITTLTLLAGLAGRRRRSIPF